MYTDYFHISPGLRAKGGLRKFGVDERKFQISVEYDFNFVSTLEEEAAKYGIAAGTLNEKDPDLDHGVIIPLAFIREQYKNFKLVRIGISGLPFSDHYVFGECISKTAEILEKNVVFVASGDLFRKTSARSQYGFAAEHTRFDEDITKAVQKGDFYKFLTFDECFTMDPAECGLRTFIIMAGALDGKEVNSKLHSCEEALDVGYGVASFIPLEENEDRKFLEIYNKLENFQFKNMKAAEDEYIALAKYSIENYIKTGKIAELPLNLPEEMLERKAGVFVSLKKHGNLRGCIGTISPVTSNIAHEIQRNAVNAATKDPRFEPVDVAELSDIVCSVDVLSPPEPVSSIDYLDPLRYGVIVASGHKRGLLLPGLEGVNTPQQQIEIALNKAGISEYETYDIKRFEVVRHK
jgi:AmmeMemoRadiSam system protein A